jgi:UDP-glucose:(heptosyl)LPS alpha-1,3-glucosyltransferase
MKIALCYESVLPARGGCETYIADLSRRLVADRHQVHLYACRWEYDALPAGIHCHQIPAVRGPRFLRPWRFGAACLSALRDGTHDVSVGFDKTWGQDVLYPQGGLHAASVFHNRNKYAGAWSRRWAHLAKSLDLAHWSFLALERKQYLARERPLIVVNSEMVRDHFRHYYEVSADDLWVVRSAIDTARFAEHARPRRRLEWRQRWNIGVDEVAGLFVAMNYRLKGLEPLLHALTLLPREAPFRLLVAGNPRFGRYERLALRLGISDRVRFLGPRRDVDNCYFAADFLLHPTFYDPCSLVVLEALACGLPVITTRANGASELLQPPSEGYVIEDPHNHAALANAIHALLDPARRSASARAARKTALEWTFERHYRELLEVFAEAARRRSAA